jgi:hypothetical protein
MQEIKKWISNWFLLCAAAVVAVLNLEVNGHTWKEVLLSCAIVALVAGVKLKLKKKEIP